MNYRNVDYSDPVELRKAFLKLSCCCSSGGIVPGDEIVGGDPNAVLFLDGASLLDTDPEFIYSGGQLGVGVTSMSAMIHAQNAGPTDITMIAQGAALQSANIQEWQNSAATVLAYINPKGIFAQPNLGNSVFIGVDAGMNSDLAANRRNVGVGENSLKAMIGGAGNTALGYDSNAGLTSGDFTTSIGYQAKGTGDKSTSLGALALSLSSGEGNMGIGYGAGGNITTGIHKTVIGFDIDAQSATVSNTLNIGNSIFGLGIDGTGTTVSAALIGFKVTQPVNTIDNGGSEGMISRTVVATSDTLDGDDSIIYVDDDTAAGVVTITLPAVSTCLNRAYTIFKKGTTANVIVDGNASETINGATTFTLTSQYESIKIHTDGIEWFIIEA